MRITHLLFTGLFLAGLALLGGMVWQVGVANLLTSVQAGGWWLVPWLGLEFLPVLLHTGGWRACFSRHDTTVSFWRLLLVRLAGSAINQVTPTATLGGEMVKVVLLTPTVPREQAAAAVVIDKASFTIAQMLHFALGTAYLAGHLPLPTELQWCLVVTLTLVSLGLLGFVAFQRYGLLSRVFDWLSRHNIAPSRLQGWRQHLLPLEAQMASYYIAHPWRFVGSLGLHLLAFLCIYVQNYLLLQLLLGAQAPTLSQTIMVTVSSGMVDQMLFFIPGSLGTYEGIRLTILSSVGVAQVYGLAFGLLSRLQNIVWNALGLLAYVGYRRLGRQPQPDPQVVTPA